MAVRFKQVIYGFWLAHNSFSQFANWDFLKVLKTMDPENRRDQMYFILANLCFAYGYLQAGFFNFTSVTLFLLSPNIGRLFSENFVDA